MAQSNQLTVPEFVAQLTIENVVCNYLSRSVSDREYILSFMDLNSYKLFTNYEVLRSVPYSLFFEILNRDTFLAEEVDILIAFSKWIEGRWSHRKAELGRRIRWNLITEDEFRKYGGFMQPHAYHSLKRILKPKRVNPYLVIGGSSSHNGSGSQTLHNDQPDALLASESLTTYPGFERDLTTRNVVPFYVSSLAKNDIAAINICLSFLDRNINQLLKKRRVVRSMPRNLLIELLKRDTFFSEKLDELDILLIVLIWIEGASNVDKSDTRVRELFEYIRWNFIAMDDYEKWIMPGRLVTKEEYMQWRRAKHARRTVPQFCETTVTTDSENDTEVIVISDDDSEDDDEDEASSDDGGVQIEESIEDDDEGDGEDNQSTDESVVQMEDNFDEAAMEYEDESAMVRFFEYESGHEKPYACCHCDRRYKLRCQIMDHYEAFKVNFTCSKCGKKSFSLYSSIAKHQVEGRCQERRLINGLRESRRRAGDDYVNRVLQPFFAHDASMQ